MLMNDTTYLLDEGLSKLIEISKMEREDRDGSSANLTDVKKEFFRYFFFAVLLLCYIDS